MGATGPRPTTVSRPLPLHPLLPWRGRSHGPHAHRRGPAPPPRAHGAHMVRDAVMDGQTDRDGDAHAGATRRRHTPACPFPPDLNPASIGSTVVALQLIATNQPVSCCFASLQALFFSSRAPWPRPRSRSSSEPSKIPRSFCPELCILYHRKREITACTGESNSNPPPAWQMQPNIPLDPKRLPLFPCHGGSCSGTSIPTRNELKPCHFLQKKLKPCPSPT